MIHHPLCPCGSAWHTGDTRAHEWIVGEVILLHLPGQALAALHTLNFGQFARWKYMGERRRWRKLIRAALFSERAVQPVDCCDGCAGSGWVERKNRKGEPVRRLCRACGQQRHVRIYRVRGPRQRQWDEANLVAACRPLIDTLVEHGFLVDDGPQWMKARYDDEHKRNQPATVIMVAKEAV